MKAITIKDIAKKCGVGVSTVSRAINNHPDISEETRNMIMEVIKESNFVPNKSARNLKLLDSKTIAVLIKGIDNPFFQNMIKIFEEEVQRRIKVIKMLYIDNEKMSHLEIAKKLGNINRKTVDRAKKVALIELAALIFGIDGVKL